MNPAFGMILNCHKKAAPDISGAVCKQECVFILAECLLNKKFGGILPKAAVFFLGTLHADLHRAAVVKAEHTHKILAVNALIFVANSNSEGLLGSQRNKLLYFMERMDHNIKFLQVCLQYYTKDALSIIIGMSIVKYYSKILNVFNRRILRFLQRTNKKIGGIDYENSVLYTWLQGKSI